MSITERIALRLLTALGVPPHTDRLALVQHILDDHAAFTRERCAKLLEDYAEQYAAAARQSDISLALIQSYGASAHLCIELARSIRLAPLPG